jgi:hypothetical protein
MDIVQTNSVLDVRLSFANMGLLQRVNRLRHKAGCRFYATVEAIISYPASLFLAVDRQFLSIRPLGRLLQVRTQDVMVVRLVIEM